MANCTKWGGLGWLRVTQGHQQTAAHSQLSIRHFSLHQTERQYSSFVVCETDRHGIPNSESRRSRILDPTRPGPTRG